MAHGPQRPDRPTAGRGPQPPAAEGENRVQILYSQADARRSLRLRPFAGSRLRRDRPSRQRELFGRPMAARRRVAACGGRTSLGRRADLRWLRPRTKRTRLLAGRRLRS